MKYRCLSLWQPWATLAAAGVKKFETRGRDTNIRGTVLIHAALTLKGMQAVVNMPEPQQEIFRSILPVGIFEKLPTGGIVGAANITMTFPSGTLKAFFAQSRKDRPLTFEESGTLGELLKHVPTLTEMRQAEAFGDYGPNRYAWQLEDCVTFKEPIPAKGSQGFFFVDLDIPEMKDFPIK